MGSLLDGDFGPPQAASAIPAPPMAAAPSACFRRMRRACEFQYWLWLINPPSSDKN